MSATPVPNVQARLVRGRWRVCEDGAARLARNAHGTPVDGGGHGRDRNKAERQAGYINAALEKRK